MIRRATVNDASRIKELYVDHFFATKIKLVAKN